MSLAWGQAEARVELPAPVDRAYAPEIERRLFYLAPEITGFELIERDGKIHEIVFTVDGPLDADSLAARTTRLIESDVTRRRPMPQKVIWETGDGAQEPKSSFDSLVSQGIAFGCGEGQIGLGEPAITIMDHLDEAITSLTAELFDVREHRYPTLIPTRALERCGYLESFPHFLMFVTRLHNDSGNYQEFAERFDGDGHVDADVLRHCRNVDYCLPPTMCYHTFNQHQGRTLGSDERRVVTSRGKSFRFESRYATTLERLWDFTIREIVFIGPREFALQSRQEIMEAAFGLVERLGLSGHCEVANDPFFRDDASEAAFSQRLLELKYELRLPVGEDRSIAVASFNFHDDFFGRSFGITRDDGDWVRTSCVGFGLERFLYAFLCQHGSEPDGWPPEVRRAVAEGARRSEAKGLEHGRA